MKLNETNNINLAALFGKLASQTNFTSMGEDGAFSGLLNQMQASKETSVPTEKEDVTKDVAPQKEKVEKKNENVEKKEASKPEKNNKEEVDSSDEEAKKESKTEEKAFVLVGEVVPQSQQENVEISEFDADGINAEAKTNISADLSMKILSEILSGMQIKTAEGVELNLSELSASDIQNIQNLVLLNPKTGEQINLSGQDLYEKISKALEQFSGVEDSTFNFDFASLNLEVQETKNKAVSQMQGATLQTNQTENVIKATLDAENIQISDAKKQIESLLKDKDVEISVDVKEEKNSYFMQRDLVKNSIELQENANFVKQQEAEISTQEKTVSPQMPINNASTSLGFSANSGIIAMPNETVAQNMPESVDVKAVSNNVNSSRVQGAEVLAFAKAEQRQSVHETLNAKDVYKGMSKEVVEQVKVNITKSAVKGVNKIEVHLKPEELGQIEIKMQIKDGKLQAHIISSRPETMEILQKNAQSLEQAFNDAGLSTDNNSLSFSFRNEQGQTQGQNDNLRNFIGNIFEEETQYDIMPQEAANQDWISEKGLNIRV